MLNLIWTFIVGIIIGLVARWIMPGAQGMGWIMTGVLGIVGSFVGGFIANLFSGSRDNPFHPAGILMSIVGAVIVLWVAQLLMH
ncbi:GlsB/YeaQ/YmgE family stress response membrane protein [Silvimonas iriomotensis]|uniref:Membrane protein n=1 Tax=Silvimonas iriomotensis TaxID=449662 RepID=A0ABQ2P7P3_9NEIS|nr:GlsB/YeaQ/YmgE family stress response membrane protein [Silvimonas iriomotensis]GGP20438.1 membrane protein [Silvimonas iriomotensis]